MFYLIRRAVSSFLSYFKYSNRHLRKGNVFDFVSASVKYGFSYWEYEDKYKIYTLNRDVRKQFLSFREANENIYKVLNKEPERQLFDNKKLFLEKFSAFVSRKWFSSRDVSIDTIRELIANKKYIAKPLGLCGGEGIVVLGVDSNQVTPQKNADNTATQLSTHPSLSLLCSNKEYVIEEFISEYNSVLQSFHPNSLNTIRVLTIQNKEDFRIIGAIARMGKDNSSVDNASAGGIFASIDVETGVIDSDGFDKKGRKYVEHPNSHVHFKNTIIPGWRNVKETLSELVKVVPNIHVVGWDLCLLADNTVEVIEGNCDPDVDILQQPKHRGIKPLVMNALSELGLR